MGLGGVHACPLDTALVPPRLHQMVGLVYAVHVLLYYVHQLFNQNQQGQQAEHGAYCRLPLAQAVASGGD